MNTPEQLTIIAAEMQTFLETKPNSEPNDLISRLEDLQVLVAKSGSCLADAKYYLDQKKNDSITQALKDAMAGDWSTTLIHKKIDALCKDANYLVNQFDRINSSAGKQLMAINVLLSYRKEEMRSFR